MSINFNYFKSVRRRRTPLLFIIRYSIFTIHSYRIPVIFPSIAVSATSPPIM